jgi:hypothetical protein
MDLGEEARGFFPAFFLFMGSNVRREREREQQWFYKELRTVWSHGFFSDSHLVRLSLFATVGSYVVEHVNLWQCVLYRTSSHN